MLAPIFSLIQVENKPLCTESGLIFFSAFLTFEGSMYKDAHQSFQCIMLPEKNFDYLSSYAFVAYNFLMDLVNASREHTLNYLHAKA